MGWNRLVISWRKLFTPPETPIFSYLHDEEPQPSCLSLTHCDKTWDFRDDKWIFRTNRWCHHLVLCMSYTWCYFITMFGIYSCLDFLLLHLFKDSMNVRYMSCYNIANDYTNATTGISLINKIHLKAVGYMLWWWDVISMYYYLSSLSKWPDCDSDKIGEKMEKRANSSYSWRKTVTQ